ncbi:MAG: hypothetical protein JJT78_17060 [Leptospira sp.]|jgi:hypothetical protein|nr:hypothetical protein [Leptospira sp.]
MIYGLKKPNRTQEYRTILNALKGNQQLPSKIHWSKNQVWNTVQTK